MIARLHSLKRIVERGWEEKDLGFLQDHAVSDWFLVKTKVSYWVEKSFFSLTVFGGILLAGDIHSSVTMDRHVRGWQWTGMYNLNLPPHLGSEAVFWASACSLETWGRILSICLLTWGLMALYLHFPTTAIICHFSNGCPDW